MQAREDADTARICAKQFAPEFKQPGTEAIRMLNRLQNNTATGNHVSFEYPSSKGSHDSKDLTDEIVVLNPPSLPSITPTTQSQLHSYNLPSSQGTNPILQGISPGYQTANNSHQNALNYQNPVPYHYHHQQQPETTNYHAGPLSSSITPSSYQLMPPSVSSISYGSTVQAPATPLPTSTTTNISSCLPNAVPHSISVQQPQQLQQQQSYQPNLIGLQEQPQTGFYSEHHGGSMKNTNINVENTTLNSSDQISADSYTTMPRYTSPQTSRTLQVMLSSLLFR